MFKKEISMFINNLSTILLLQIDILLISYLYGKKSAGIYLIAFKIPNTLIMLGWRISEPFQPIVAKGIKENKKEIFKKFKKLEKIVFLVAVIFALGYLLFGETALKIWVGEKNIPNINYMYLIPSLAIFFSILQRLYLSVNFYTKGLNIVSLLQFLEIASKVIFTIFFFDIFKELSPTAGWVFAFFFTIWLYRKNAIRIFNR
jgi:O-antigen/teichoic acid export membrane protein